ncbi:MAG: hypothetical protein K8R41_02605 [Bacteroidales bacterium]|nr:hypothetical protein [Bacteroidales bacterium]
MKLRIKSTKKTILILGLYQIIGALFGFYLIAKLLLRTSEINGVILLIYLIAIGLYCLSMKAGSLLIRKEYKRGLLFSLINQILQTIAYAVGGYKYYYFSGAKLSTGLNFNNGFELKFDFGITSEFGLSWNSGDEYYLYINVLAIFLIYVIIDIYEETFKKNKNIENSEMKEVHEIISKD